MTRIDVMAASASAVSPLFSGWGTVTRDGGVASSAPPILCACSGRDASGRDVIALLDAPTEPGAVVEPRDSSMVFARPSQPGAKPWSHAAAAQLPLLALTAAAALHSVGLPAGSASIGHETNVPANLCIAGSSGRLPGLLVQIAAARGIRTCVAARCDASKRLREMGAAEVIDHDAVSFSTAFGARKSQPLDAVFDCIGVEAEGAAATNEALGATYVSLASPSLIRLQADGAMGVLRAQWQQWRGGGAEGQQKKDKAIWCPDELAANALREVIALIADGRVEPPPEANAALEELDQCARHYKPPSPPHRTYTETTCASTRHTSALELTVRALHAHHRATRRRVHQLGT